MCQNSTIFEKPQFYLFLAQYHVGSQDEKKRFEQISIHQKNETIFILFLVLALGKFFATIFSNFSLLREDKVCAVRLLDTIGHNLSMNE